MAARKGESEAGSVVMDKEDQEHSQKEVIYPSQPAKKRVPVVVKPSREAMKEKIIASRLWRKEDLRYIEKVYENRNLYSDEIFSLIAQFSQPSIYGIDKILRYLSMNEDAKSVAGVISELFHASILTSQGYEILGFGLLVKQSPSDVFHLLAAKDGEFFIVNIKNLEGNVTPLGVVSAIVGEYRGQSTFVRFSDFLDLIRHDKTFDPGFDFWLETQTANQLMAKLRSRRYRPHFIFSLALNEVAFKRLSEDDLNQIGNDVQRRAKEPVVKVKAKIFMSTYQGDLIQGLSLQKILEGDRAMTWSQGVLNGAKEGDRIAYQVGNDKKVHMALIEMVRKLSVTLKTSEGREIFYESSNPQINHIRILRHFNVRVDAQKNAVFFGQKEFTGRKIVADAVDYLIQGVQRFATPEGSTSFLIDRNYFSIIPAIAYERNSHAGLSSFTVSRTLNNMPGQSTAITIFKSDEVIDWLEDLKSYILDFAQVSRTPDRAMMGKAERSLEAHIQAAKAQGEIAVLDFSRAGAGFTNNYLRSQGYSYAELRRKDLPEQLDKLEKEPDLGKKFPIFIGYGNLPLNHTQMERLLKLIKFPSGEYNFDTLQKVSDAQWELLAKPGVDFLTKLYNLEGFTGAANRALGSEIRSKGRVHVVMGFMDADFLKSLNDLFGHDIANIVIKGIANVIRPRRSTDLSGRWSAGDEFVFLLPVIEGEVHPNDRLNRFLESIRNYDFSKEAPILYDRKGMIKILKSKLKAAEDNPSFYSALTFQLALQNDIPLKTLREQLPTFAQSVKAADHVLKKTGWFGL